jgi:hypothetical protein
LSTKKTAIKGTPYLIIAWQGEEQSGGTNKGDTIGSCPPVMVIIPDGYDNQKFEEKGICISLTVDMFMSYLKTAHN